MEQPSDDARIVFETRLAVTTAGMLTYPFRTWETCSQSQYRFWRQHALHRFSEHKQFKYLFRGLMPFTIGTIFSITCSEMFEKQMLSQVTISPKLSTFLMILPTTLTFVPFEVWFKRCQVFADERPRDIFYNKMRTEGLIGLYRGFTVSTIQHAVATAIPIYLVPSMVSVWPNVFNDSRSQLALMSGAYLFSVIPLEVVKTRLMVARYTDVEATSSAMSIAARIVSKEGFMQLYSGWFPHTVVIGSMIAALIFISLRREEKSPNNNQ